MGHEEQLKKKLSNALSLLNKFSQYCSQYGIDIYELKVVVYGNKNLIPFTNKNIHTIAWYAHGLERRIIIKFKSSKMLKLGNGLEYGYNSYQIQLQKLSLTVLKNSVKEEDKQGAQFIVDIKKWAKTNKVYFHKYVGKDKFSGNYDCAVLVTSPKATYGVGVGKKDNKFIVESWIGYDTDNKQSFNSVKEVFDYLNKWVNLPEVREAKMARAKAFVFKDKIVCASNRTTAVKVFATANLLGDLSIKSQAEQEMMVLNALSNLRGINLEKVFTNIDIVKLKNLIEKYPEYEKKLPSRLRRLCKYNAIVTQD